MYFTGQVPAQDLWATLRDLITKVSPTGQPYWEYIGSVDTDGAFRSKDGNDIIVRIANAGIGWAMAMGVFESYTPGTPGSPGVFGPGDVELLFYYNGSHNGYNGSGYNYWTTWYPRNYYGAYDTWTFYPYIGNTRTGETGPMWPQPSQGETRTGYMNTPVILSGGSTTFMQYNCLPPTAMVNYWIVVTPQCIHLVLQGDPAYSSSLMQFCSVGLLRKWSQEPGNWASYILPTQWKGNGPSLNTSWPVRMLRTKNGSKNVPYQINIPWYSMSQLTNVWTGSTQFSPFSVYHISEGFRGDIPGIAAMTPTGSVSGDEFTAIDPNGVQQVWKRFNLQMTTWFGQNIQAMPTMVIALLQDNN